MGRRVLLAFLGSNDYLECNYFFENKKLNNVKYVQEAIADFFCKNWTKNDKILIFTTKKSFDIHWKELQKSLSRFQCDVSNINIPDCANENELWQMFDIITNSIQENDKIIFDVTHGFRLMPLFAISALNYLESIKKVDIKGIYYGAFETLGSISQAKEMEICNRNVPIFDLTSTHIVQKWAKATEIFEETGRSNQIKNLSENAIFPLLKQSKGKNKEALDVKNIINEIYKLTYNIRASRSNDIINHNFSLLKEKINNLKDQKTVRPLKAILEKIENNFENFSGKDDIIINSFAIIDWCIKYDLIQQGHTYLIETIYTYLVILENKNADIWDNKLREDHINKCFEDDFKILNHILSDSEKKNFIGKLRDLQKFRNDINHCGYRKDSHSPEKLKEKLEEYYKFFKEILLKGA